MSFKVGAKVGGELVFNGLRFQTREEGEAYGKDLFSRWTLTTGYEVQESEDAVNYRFTDKGLESVDQLAETPTN